MIWRRIRDWLSIITLRNCNLNSLQLIHLQKDKLCRLQAGKLAPVTGIFRNRTWVIQIPTFSTLRDKSNYPTLTRIFHKIQPSGGLFFQISLLRALPAPRRGETTSAGPKSPAPRPSKKSLHRRRSVIIHPCRMSFKYRRLDHFERLPVKSCEISGLMIIILRATL